MRRGTLSRKNVNGAAPYERPAPDTEGIGFDAIPD